MENNTTESRSFAVEVIADSSGKFVGNGVNLATRAEADEYGRDLQGRWLAVREYRVVERTECPNYAFVNGRLTALTVTA